MPLRLGSLPHVLVHCPTASLFRAPPVLRFGFVVIIKRWPMRWAHGSLAFHIDNPALAEFHHETFMGPTLPLKVSSAAAELDPNKGNYGAPCTLQRRTYRDARPTGAPKSSKVDRLAGQEQAPLGAAIAVYIPVSEAPL